MIPLILVLSGCASKPVRTVEFGDMVSSRHRVLIATQESVFKEAVAAEVIDGLERELCHVRLIDVGRLDEESTEDYDAIVIATLCVARHTPRRVERFIDRVREKDKVVLLVTAGSGKCGSRPSQVDAITSASTMNNAVMIAESIIERVEMLLSSHD